MNKAQFKKNVKLSQMPGEKLGHTYNRIARAFGYKDWNAMSADDPFDSLYVSWPHDPEVFYTHSVDVVKADQIGLQ